MICRCRWAGSIGIVGLLSPLLPWAASSIEFCLPNDVVVMVVRSASPSAQTAIYRESLPFFFLSGDGGSAEILVFCVWCWWWSAVPRVGVTDTLTCNYMLREGSPAKQDPPPTPPSTGPAPHIHVSIPGHLVSGRSGRWGMVEDTRTPERA